MSRVTDDVIDKAVRVLPKAYFDLSGEEIRRTLKQRRNNLERAAIKFYKHLAKEVNIHCTNQDEWVDVHRSDNGDVEVKVSPMENGTSTGDYYFQRRFHPKETKEIRIYLFDGRNIVVSSGGRFREIKVRVIGGEGEDRVDDSKGGGLYFADTTGSQLIRGPGSEFDGKTYNPPPPKDPDNTLIVHRDWGRRTAPQAYPGFSSDIGLFVGAGISTTGYGFRYVPHSDSHSIMGARDGLRPQRNIRQAAE